MLLYKIEKSLEGIFKGVFCAYTLKERPEIVTSGAGVQCGFCCEVRQVFDGDAARVERGLKRILGEQFYTIETAYCSGAPDKETVIFNYICKVFEMGKKVLSAVHLPDVSAFVDCVRRVELELRHMYGFLRFKETKNGMYYAEISPDNDITALIMPHFAARFSSLKFVIHDIKRNILGLYNGSEYRVTKDVNVEVILSEEENTFSALWRQYIKNVALPDRKKPALQARCMPRRYQRSTDDFG